MSKSRNDDNPIPDRIVDLKTNINYTKGKFLGKGGFANCYELIKPDKSVFAGKIVSKAMLIQKNQKAKMLQEIKIHKELNHINVVGFISFFEDINFVYVLLELCSNRSLMELHKRRRTVSELEARYFMRHIIDGTAYLHDLKIIHRDMKLGNLFLNHDMQVKIGDFGLATQVTLDGEKKKTLCGTPNYIAPEMLAKKGHSYEVDIWAIGCILYTLLEGKPPFETNSLKETYNKIKKNDYHFKQRTSTDAREFIRRLLAPNPTDRPQIHECLTYKFFEGWTPKRLPESCCSMAPKFPSQSQLPPYQPSVVRPLSQVNREPADIALSTKELVRRDLIHAPLRNLDTVQEEPKKQRGMRSSEDGAMYMDVKPETPQIADSNVPPDFYMSELRSQLLDVINAVKAKVDENPNKNDDDISDPKNSPIYWISKWVDYSDKYGLGYQLSDNSVGVLFNDLTKMVLDEKGVNVQYIERDNRESYYSMQQYPSQLNKKFTLLKYFRSYMIDHLLRAGTSIDSQKEDDDMARLPCLRTWFRTRSAIILHLTNGTLQINFFNDHTKVIICPLMQAVTYIDSDCAARTLAFDRIKEAGCSNEVYTRLRYAFTMVERLLQTQSTSIMSSQTSKNDKCQSGSKSTVLANSNLHRVSSELNNARKDLPFPNVPSIYGSLATMPSNRNQMATATSSINSMPQMPPRSASNDARRVPF